MSQPRGIGLRLFTRIRTFGSDKGDYPNQLFENRTPCTDFTVKRRCLFGLILTLPTSAETFLDQGFGFTMLDGTSVVCWCTAEYVSEGKCGIGIETIEAYQGRGIATVVAGEFVRHALASGVNPHWDCWASNTPSVRVAEKVGFADMHDYKIAIGSFGDG